MNEKTGLGEGERKSNSRLTDELRAARRKIAALNRAKDALKVDEELYRLIFENSGNAILLTKPDGTISAANPEACRMFGKSEKQIKKIGRAGIVDPKDPRVQAAIDERRRTGRFEGEFNCVKKDGTVFPCDVSSKIFKDSNGNERTVMIIRDLTERKDAENRLRETKAEYRNLFEDSLLAISQATPDGRMIRANKSYAHMYGYSSPAQWIAEKDNIRQRYAHPEDREDVLRILKEKGIMEPREFELVRRDGTRFTALVAARAVKDPNGKLLYYQATHVDITERKRAEEALRESRERLDLAVRAAHMGVWHWDIIENKRYFDDQVCRLLGIDPVTFTGAADEFYRAVHPEDREMLKAALARTVEQGVVYEPEYRAVWPDGRVHYIEARGKLVRDHTGRPIKINGLIWDITERKRADANLRRSHQELRALSTCLQALREEDRTEVAREIHDELGQALSALKMDLSWMTKRLPAKPPLFQEKAADMSAIINTTIGMIRQIATRLRPALLDDLGLIAAMEWQADEFRKRTGIKLRFSTKPKRLVLDADRSTTFFRIFQELLTNVARHAEAANVVISFRKNAASYEMIVKDDGRGIEKKAATNSQSLGLIGIRERAQAFDGTVEIRGTRGRGTTVIVRLPAERRGE